MDMLEKLSLAGLVPVIKIENSEDAVPLCKALSDGGLPVAEITFRTDAAQQAIENVHGQLPDVLLGAGTVLTVDQVKRAVGAGASYIVSPGFNPDVVGYCVKNGIAVLPGCANPSDIEMALSYGLKTVKFFPAEALGGLKLIKAMSAPYGGISFVPTGGIDEKNVLEYLCAPCVKAVGGSWMVPGDAIRQKDWARITALAAGAVKLMLGFELKHIGINSESAEGAMETAKALGALLGQPVNEGNSSVFAGASFEVMKRTGPGANGHIAIGVNSVERAVWHLKKRGYAFDEGSSSIKDGKLVKIYFADEIGGFAFHLIQK